MARIVMKFGGTSVADLDRIRKEIQASPLLSPYPAELGADKFTDVDLNVVFEDLQYKAYRQTVLTKGVRADGRGQGRPKRSGS